LTRRHFLGLAAGLPVTAIIAACSGSSGSILVGGDEENAPAGPPEPTATPEPPFIVNAGEERRLLMAGTPYETPYYIFGSGQPGAVMTLLGGVHGNEPGGWMAAERLLETMRPTVGALIILPRANKLAIGSFVRTTDEMGDLNRAYPGKPDGLPMEQMAAQIVDFLREFRVSVLVDMHESWAFYKDRPQNGTAFLGQTVATNPVDPGASLAQAVVATVNETIRSSQEELFFREFPRNRLPEPTSARPFDTSGNPEAAVSGGSRSSLGLPAHVPGIVSLLVEMGQQQTLERRIALHAQVAEEVGRRVGVLV
jgi:hypothetical protein